MARILMARLPCLELVTYLFLGPYDPIFEFLWSSFCIYGFMLLFSFSVFSDRRSVKIENKNTRSKILTAEAPYIGLESLEFSI